MGIVNRPTGLGKIVDAARMVASFLEVKERILDDYRISDRQRGRARFGGFDRVDLSFVYKTEKQKDDRIGFKCYLPARTAIVFEELE